MWEILLRLRLWLPTALAPEGPAQPRWTLQTRRRYLNQSTRHRLAPSPNAFILLPKRTTELRTAKYDIVGKVQNVQSKHSTYVQCLQVIYKRFRNTWICRNMVAQRPIFRCSAVRYFPDALPDRPRLSRSALRRW